MYHFLYPICIYEGAPGMGMYEYNINRRVDGRPASDG